MPVTVVDRFDGDYAFLSNFYPSPVIVWSGPERITALRCPTVEHAFQACKTLDVDERIAIAAAPTAAQAKRLGRNATLREGWEDIKVNVMGSLITQKFEAGTDLAAALVATGSAELIEGNTWGDKFWGVCDGEGSNMLGQLLMARREWLAAVGSVRVSK